MYKACLRYLNGWLYFSWAIQDWYDLMRKPNRYFSKEDWISIFRTTFFENLNGKDRC
jgi:hypothetical protein